MHSEQSILCRRARREDSQELATLMDLASGGANEFALGNLVRGKSAIDVLALVAGRDDTIFSYRRCHVAEAEGRIVGAANCYTPGDEAELGANALALLPWMARRRLRRRIHHLRAFRALACSESYTIDTIAVKEDCRGRGFGALLMEAIKRSASQRGLSRVSLQMWADNQSAMAFYRRHGFEVRCAATVKPHRRLERSGEILLMVCDP